MSDIRVVKCVYSDSWSLEWLHHNEEWSLTLFEEDGNEATILITLDELKSLQSVLTAWEGEP